jgi:hypothetical protein
VSYADGKIPSVKLLNVVVVLNLVYNTSNFVIVVVVVVVVSLGLKKMHLGL